MLGIEDLPKWWLLLLSLPKLLTPPALDPDKLQISGHAIQELITGLSYLKLSEVLSF